MRERIPQRSVWGSRRCLFARVIVASRTEQSSIRVEAYQVGTLNSEPTFISFTNSPSTGLSSCPTRLTSVRTTEARIKAHATFFRDMWIERLMAVTSSWVPTPGVVHVCRVPGFSSLFIGLP